jgi:hypothetical protein
LAIFLVFDADLEIADDLSQVSDERGQLHRRFKLGYGLHGLSQVGAGRFGLTHTEQPQCHSGDKDGEFPDLIESFDNSDEAWTFAEQLAKSKNLPLYHRAAPFDPSEPVDIS